MVGRKFNRLTVVSEHDKRGFETRWLCQCECGNQSIVMGKNLRKGTTKSCGCYATEQRGKTNLRHGMHGSREYQIWADMKARCGNTSHNAFAQYGGRGISVCARWQSFELFLADMGERPRGFWIDRIDVNGNYEPSNCRWASAKEQGNNRRSNIRIAIGDEVKTLMQWCEQFGLVYYRVRNRLARGWEPLGALGIDTNLEVKRV